MREADYTLLGSGQGAKTMNLIHVLASKELGDY